MPSGVFIQKPNSDENKIDLIKQTSKTNAKTNLKSKSYPKDLNLTRPHAGKVNDQESGVQN